MRLLFPYNTKETSRTTQYLGIASIQSLIYIVYKKEVENIEKKILEQSIGDLLKIPKERPNVPTSLTYIYISKKLF